MEKAYWIGLHLLPGIGARKVLQLIDYFGSAEMVWKSSESDLRRVSGLTGKDVDSIIIHRKNIHPFRELERTVKAGIKVLTLVEPEYPMDLKRIYDPPPVLYYKGLIRQGDALAVVGARKATSYGIKAATLLASQLASEGFTIVSGMARGIDTAAHVGALQAGGYTIAVLGSGLDIVYPPENSQLFRQIEERGAVVSEFPLGTPPSSQNFPARNRIISGWARGTIVVEAAEKSGSLITVDFALEQGRDVFAVPGPITSKLSIGTNNLIKQGAKLVTSAEDVLEEYGVQPLFESHSHDVKTTVVLSPEEKQVLQLISWEPIHRDQVFKKLDASWKTISSALMLLELKGFIRCLPGDYYVST